MNIEEIKKKLELLLPTTHYEISDYKEESFKWASNYQNDIKYLLSIIEQAKRDLVDMDIFIDVNPPDRPLKAIKPLIDVALQAIRGE